AFVERREILLQTLRDVIRIEDCDLRCFGQTGCTHRGDVNPGDGEETGTAPRRRSDGTDRLEFNRQVVPNARRFVNGNNRMARQKSDQVLGHANRSHARSAAAVGDAKRLVQVQVTDVRAEVGGTAQAYLGVQICAVHVNLPAKLV